jgi:hypothetical protein
VIQAAEDGAVNGGARLLALEAAKSYPANRIFVRILVEIEVGPVAPPFGGGEGVPPVPPLAEPEPPPLDPRANDHISSRSYFIVGFIALVAALGFAIWGFMIPEPTDVQREILRWIVSIASGFASGSFAGGFAIERKQRGKRGGLIVATSGFAVWFIVFLLIFRPPGIPYSLHVAFEDADDPSSGIDGRFVIVLGSEEHQCVLENQLSCRIPDIPERFVGTTMTTRLDGSAHRIIKGPYAIERDGNVTIFVQKRRQLFELRATFVRGKVIEFAPEPKMLSVKPTLRLSSGSSSPISVGHYDIAVLGKDGNTVMKQHYVHDFPSSVEPGNVLDVTLDLLIPRSAVEGRRANGTLRVTVLDGGASDSGPVVVHAEVDVSLDDPDLDWLSDGSSSGATEDHGGDTGETGTDLQPCPTGSLLVSVEGADPTCIETTPREPLDRRSASNVCKSSGWDLCRSSVYKRACTQYGDVQLEQNAVEFTFDSPGLTYEGCVNVGRSPSPERAQYRCCIGPTSSAVPSPGPRLSVPSGVRCDEWVVHHDELVCKVCRASLSLSSHIQNAIGSVSCGPMKPGIIEASIENTITGDSFYENDPGNNEMAGRYEYEFWLGKRSGGEQCDGSRCFRSCNAPAKDAEGCVFDKIVKTQPDALVLKQALEKHNRRDFT